MTNYLHGSQNISRLNLKQNKTNPQNLQGVHVHEAESKWKPKAPDTAERCRGGCEDNLDRSSQGEEACPGKQWGSIWVPNKL